LVRLSPTVKGFDANVTVKTAGFRRAGGWGLFRRWSERDTFGFAREAGRGAGRPGHPRAIANVAITPVHGCPCLMGLPSDSGFALLFYYERPKSRRKKGETRV
jgi:hypothetical protein